ncbi:MAG: RNA polymerase sigma factor RpoD/SigA [Candidatus Symbiothrix sp.]|jgi:RNA polymerase primary sigma factor|nr:RNA polymerase sigma factor RpoD/SigA [Candidatus Symbiothrix sp.]
MRQLKISQSLTPRESGSLNAWLKQIGRYPLVSPNEEVELSEAIKRGDQRALDTLVNANLRFVVSVAKQYATQGIALEDLVQWGNIGLIKAAKMFDATRGFKFISYAVWWIRQSILQSIAEQSRIVRLPLNRVNDASKSAKIKARFEQENERTPTVEELADITDIPADRLSEVLLFSGKHTSIDAPFVEGEDGSLIDVLINDDAPAADRDLMQESLKKDINRVLSLLSDRERKIVMLCFGLAGNEMNLEEIGYKEGLTRERVRQIKDKAIRRLKLEPETQLLKQYC